MSYSGLKEIEGVDLEDKNVLLRTDLNLPVEDQEPQKTVRFERYLRTVRELSEQGARIMVMAHQGRPTRKDFLSLEDHAEIMGDELDVEVGLVKCFFGLEVEQTMNSMENGGVALLENVRFLSEELQSVSPEKHSRDYFVENLKDHFDVFVNDAFSAAHRSHSSMVGFTPVLESYAGPVMVRELKNGKKVRDEMDSPLLVFGGEKPSDLIGMLDQMIDRAEKVLLGGVPGELALKIKGAELGEKADWIDSQGFNGRVHQLEEMLKDYEDKFVLPGDLRTDSGNYEVGEIPGDEMTWDIGEETQERFVREIEDADSIVMKGPMGAFEEHPEGTKAVVGAIADNNGFTVLGGGHTSSLVHRFGHEIDDFTHISIAGGAFVRYMSGEELPAVEALKNYS